MKWDGNATPGRCSFNLVLFVALFAILLTQHLLPLNPQKAPSFSWQLALNTAVSFLIPMCAVGAPRVNVLVLNLELDRLTR